MDIFVNGSLFRSPQYQPTWQDLEYTELMGTLSSMGVLRNLGDKSWKAEERGKDANCYWTELFFWQSLIAYLINMKDAFMHIQCPTEEDIENLELNYDIECIRNTALCKFNGTEIFDALYNKLGISIDGLDNMSLENSNVPCTPVIIVQ